MRDVHLRIMCIYFEIVISLACVMTHQPTSYIGKFANLEVFKEQNVKLF